MDGRDIAVIRRGLTIEYVELAGSPFPCKTAMRRRRYFGVSFNSLLVRGVRGDIEEPLLSVNT